MQVMDANLRKISLKDGASLGALSLAMTAGFGMALHTAGRDPWQAVNVLVPVFVGTLITAAGINPVQSPRLMALVGSVACGVMWMAKQLVN